MTSPVFQKLFKCPAHFWKSGV